MHGDVSTVDFGGMIEALPGLLWTTQTDGRCDFVNRGWREFTGLGLDEAIDDGWRKAIHPDDRTGFLSAMQHKALLVWVHVGSPEVRKSA